MDLPWVKHRKLACAASFHPAPLLNAISDIRAPWWMAIGYSFPAPPGFDYQTMTISDNVVEQAEQCLRNIEMALLGCREPDRRCGPGSLHPAQSGGFRAVLARAAPLLRRRPARRHHDLSRPFRSSHEDRNRSYRPQTRHLNPAENLASFFHHAAPERASEDPNRQQAAEQR